MPVEALVAAIATAVVLVVEKPSFVYSAHVGEDGTVSYRPKHFGFNIKSGDETVFPVWLVSALIGFVFYVLEIII
jgi:hypothetical protein